MMGRAVEQTLEPATKHKLGSLEIGRFIAALAVLVSHFTPDINRHAAIAGQQVLGGFVGPGPLGLQYFFTLSGFVMASAHYQDFGRLVAIPKFWWRRACRIYPVYWLALTIPIYYLHGGLTPGFYLQLFSLDPWNSQELIPAAWSLRYELAFYIIFGFCLLPYIGKPLLFTWMFLTFWRWCPQSLLPYLHLRIPFELNHLAGFFGFDFVAFFEFFFFAGLAGGWAYRAIEPGKRASMILLGGGVAALGLSMPELHWGAAYGPPMFMIFDGFVLAAIMLGLAGLERHRVLRLGRMATICGALSFPLYMLHEPLMLIMDVGAPKLKLGIIGMHAVFLSGLLMMFSVAGAVTFLFDRPLQRQLRQLRLPVRWPVASV